MSTFSISDSDLNVLLSSVYLRPLSIAHRLLSSFDADRLITIGT